MVEIRQARGRVLKHAGDLRRAAMEMEQAREMDLQDRFVNIVSTKYLLSAGQHEDAVRVAGGFTKTGVDPEKNLDEMQALWFASRAAAAHNAAGRHGRALKKFLSMESHLREMQSDHPSERNPNHARLINT